MELWFGEQKKWVKDSYLIPFEPKSSKSHEMCVVKEGYCESIEVDVPVEDYRLEVGYIYGSESFIVGNKAKIILHPRLYLQANSMKVDLGLVKDVKITVDMENNQGIKNTLEFDNVKFSSSKDYVLEVPIQSYIKRIDIAVAGVVKDTYS